MRKRGFWLLLVAIVIMGFSINVYADEAYYTTANGIELSREEYEFLSTFYGTPYVDIMTRDQYNEFVEEDLINSDVTYKTVTTPNTVLINPGNNINSTSTSTQAKTLQIGAACLPTKCIMSLVNTWHVDPATTSWDVIGAWFDDVSLISHSHTYVSSSNTTAYFTNIKTESDGIGNSVYLPEDGTDLIINMAFTVTRGGTVYGSYQHAIEDTTLANSQLYHLDFSGYGNVFDFYSTAIDVYDQMNGVDIDV